MVRDQEIERLTKYAEGLGIKVVTKTHARGGPGAAWVKSPDNKVELILYVWKNKSKTRVILDFIHELAHHLAWVYRNRSFDDRMTAILEKNHLDAPLSKKERYQIFKEERDDSNYRLQIAHEIGIKLPEIKIKIDIDLDIWIYYTWYETNALPSSEKTREKRKELLKKYKNIV